MVMLKGPGDTDCLKFSFDYYNNEKYLLNYKIENLLVLFSSQALPRKLS